MSDPIPAATVIVFRDRRGAPPELLMVERARAMAFAGGAMVFPGGRVDPGDRLAGDRGDDDAAARIAAIRETIEEAGLAVGLDRSPAPAVLADIRAALREGEPLPALLARHDLRFATDRLVPFARWRPSHAPARIFDTRFYLASLPSGAPDASVDRTENVRLCWTTAADMLAAADAGHATIIFPTRRTLERLATYTSFTEAAADAARHPIRTISPWSEMRGGEEWLHIPDDLGYPVTAERLSTATRG